LCLDRASHVQVRVYQRLIAQGVKPARASAVARKVRRAYVAKAQEAGERPFG
jgi:hypothetical protein